MGMFEFLKPTENAYENDAYKIDNYLVRDLNAVFKKPDETDTDNPDGKVVLEFLNEQVQDGSKSTLTVLVEQSGQAALTSLVKYLFTRLQEVPGPNQAEIIKAYNSICSTKGLTQSVVDELKTFYDFVNSEKSKDYNSEIDLATLQAEILENVPSATAQTAATTTPRPSPALAPAPAPAPSPSATPTPQTQKVKVRKVDALPDI